MAKRDPNGPTAKLEEVHRLLCVGTGKLATMMAVRKMDVPTILEIEADVQRAAASMKDFSHLMVELNRRRDAEQAETKSESDESAGGSAGDGDGGGGNVSGRRVRDSRPRRTRGAAGTS